MDDCCRRRLLVPWQRGSSGEPGTASTSRPCSRAIRAVISEPDCRAASTTSTPRLRPEMSRLRLGKCLACGTVPGGISPPRDLPLQLLVVGRIGNVDAAGDDGDRAAVEAAAMGRVID